MTYGGLACASAPATELQHRGEQQSARESHPRTQTLPRKEVIQPHVPVRLPCYDFVPVTDFTLDACLPKVGAAASDASDFHDVTGGVYKARERIQRSVLTCVY